MDKEWSEKNKEIQRLLSKEATFPEAIEQLITFRKEMLEQIVQMADMYPEEAFSKRPFPNAEGYHSKTLAYSVWHIFRIEDIVAHEMIAIDSQVLFRDGFLERINSPGITTGNELEGEAIEEFSKRLNVQELVRYAQAVAESTDEILRAVDYKDSKSTFGEEIKADLAKTGCISEDEKAVWLIEYWCGKNVAGLIKMPFSRHWIMHIEAMRRICKKLG